MKELTEAQKRGFNYIETHCSGYGLKNVGRQIATEELILPGKEHLNFVLCNTLEGFEKGVGEIVKARAYSKKDLIIALTNKHDSHFMIVLIEDSGAYPFPEGTLLQATCKSGQLPILSYEWLDNLHQKFNKVRLEDILEDKEPL